MNDTPKRKRGRPPATDPREASLTIRLTPEERRALEIAAESTRETLATYVRRVLLGPRASV